MFCFFLFILLVYIVVYSANFNCKRAITNMIQNFKQTMLSTKALNLLENLNKITEQNTQYIT